MIIESNQTNPKICETSSQYKIYLNAILSLTVLILRYTGGAKPSSLKGFFANADIMDKESVIVDIDPMDMSETKNSWKFVVLNQISVNRNLYFNIIFGDKKSWLGYLKHQG